MRTGVSFFVVRFRELVATFSRLTQRVDLSEAELEADIRQLSFRIQRLENIQRRSKAFRSEVTQQVTTGGWLVPMVTDGGLKAARPAVLDYETK